MSKFVKLTKAKQNRAPGTSMTKTTGGDTELFAFCLLIFGFGDEHYPPCEETPIKHPPLSPFLKSLSIYLQILFSFLAEYSSIM